MTYLKNKSVSFYLIALAAVLSVVAVFFYRTAQVTDTAIIALVVISVVVAVAMMVLAGLKSKPRFLNLTATVCAVILAWAFVNSFSAQLDPLGWWISGLYTFEQVVGFIVFAVLILLAVILNLVASFIDLQK